MMTCWIPFGDYTKYEGTLAVCKQSHLLTGFSESDYLGEAKAELPESFPEFQEHATWVTTDFRMGDMVVFDIRTIHASTANLSSNYRMSMDTRWQPTRCVPPTSYSFFTHFDLLGQALQL
eukprot:TRINITY_DN12781_c0_g1_i3.p1 TRINITY_DN12781_c0_g1~~TRINITY_DN12781_c0_g1_i3.p1  ORF type:complete len:120 (-),score=5.24 TRINITY_DN12781_c0_g1_i3:30-389(-)